MPKTNTEGFTTAQILKQAIIEYRQSSTDVHEVEAIQTFIALYDMLGEVELRDGIATEMQDAGYDEAYEDIMYRFDELKGNK